MLKTVKSRIIFISSLNLFILGLLCQIINYKGQIAMLEKETKQWVQVQADDRALAIDNWLGTQKSILHELSTFITYAGTEEHGAIENYLLKCLENNPSAMEYYI